jgi:hypothetical protein
MSAPFDGAIFTYVLLFAVAVLLLMRFVPPVGAGAMLGAGARRFAHVPADALDDAVQDEGKRAYFSAAGLIAIVLCGVVWRIVVFYGPVIERNLREAGVSGWLAFSVSVLPAILPPFLYKYTTRWLLMRRLERKFAHA